MKHLYRIIFLLIFLFSFNNLNARSYYRYLDKEKKNVAENIDYLVLPTATISTSAPSVCFNGMQPVITFTGIGGTAPYTFTYKINNGSDIITSQSIGDIVKLNVPTTLVGDFVYTLVSVSDSSSPSQTQTQSGNAMVTVNALPVIDFSFTNDNQCSGSAVQFTSNITSGGTFVYLWSFGDNTTSTQQHPSHVFNAISGTGIQTFNVILTVTNVVNNCSSSIIKSVLVKRLPDSSLDISNNNGGAFYDVSQSIFLNCGATSSSPQFDFIAINASSTVGTNTSYTIDWGDSTISNFTNVFSSVTHKYNSLGFFNIVFTTINSSTGCSSSKTYKFFNGNTPAGNLAGIANTTDCVPYTLTWPVENTQENTPGTTYTFSVNDGSPSQTFTQATLPTTISHVFIKSSCDLGLTSNKFTVSFKINNPCGESAPTNQVQATQKPIASFTTSPNSSFCTNSNIVFTNTSIGSYIAGNSCNINFNKTWTITPSTGWTLNSGTLNGTDVINVVFNTSGNYSISLNIRKPGSTASRCTDDTIVKTICVESKPTPLFSLSTNEGCLPLTVNTVNNTNTANNCSAVSYAWEVLYTNGYCGTAGALPYFSGGTSSISASPIFLFTNPGTYTIKLSATNLCGTQVTTQTVIVKKPPTVTINAIANFCQTSATTIINPIATTIDCGTQSHLIYEWSFPNGTPSTSLNANPGPISYSASGTFSFSLKVTNECGSTTANSSFTIKPTPIVDDITSQQKCKGQQSDAILFSGGLTGTIYNWTNSNLAIGLVAVGSGNISPFMLTNAGTTVLTSTITVTPSLNGCVGTSKSFTITVNPEATVNAISNLVLCNNGMQNVITFTSAATGTTFSWTNNTPSIGLAASGTGNIPVFTATNSGTSPFVATITVTPSNIFGCNGISKTFTITINPSPSALVLTNREFCNGVVTTPITFSNLVAGTTYTWNNSNTAIGLAANGTGTILSFTPTNVGSNPITATISVTPTANGCSGASQTFTITVNPSPVVTFLPTNQVICSGDTSALVTLKSTTPGVTFNWTAIQPAGIAVVLTSGTDTIPAQTLINSTNANIVVTYNANATLASGASCAGAAFPYTITVKPKPYVAANMTTAICSGLSFTVTPTNGAGNIIPLGTTYSWGIPVVTGGITGGAALANQTTISGTLANLTNSSQTATYTVTPSYNGCTGLPFDVIISVNPKPVIPIQLATICSGEAFTVTPSNGIPSSAIIIPLNTTYTWATPISNPIGMITGGTAQATGQTIINQTLTNISNVPATLTYTVTPKSGDNGNCPGATFTVTVTINPKPYVTPQIKTICSGTAFTLSPTNGGGNIVSAGTTYTWSDPASNPIGAITGGSLQAIDQPNISQTLTNMTNFSGTLTYTVTPKSGASGNCVGTPFTVTITVDPSPSALMLTNQEFCNGVLTAPIVFSNAVLGTTYTWTNSNTAIGLAASGTGNIPSFSPTNVGTSLITAIITVTPKAITCLGASQTFAIKVNPSPVVIFSPTDQTICSGDTSTLVTLSSVAGSTFNWTAVQPAGISGISSNGTDTIPGQTLINSTNANIIVTYNATATLASGTTCAGAVFPYTITVKPKPFISANITATSCSGLSFSVSPTNGARNSIPSGTTYSWIIPIVTGGITGGIAGTNPATISGTLTNPTNIVQTATYTVIPSFNGCSGLPFDVVVTVNPKPDVNTTSNIVLCAGEASTQIDFAGNVFGATYTWSSNTTSIGIAISGTNTIPSFTAINTGTTPVIATITVTPSANSCRGLPKTFTITVNPTPSVNSITNLVECNNTASGSIAFTESVSSTTYTWTNDKPSIGLAVSGNGNIPTFNLTNSGITPVMATITVIPTAIGCSGAAKTFTITVNPTPTVNLSINQIVCNGQSSAAVLFSGAIPNTTYRWTNNNQTIGIGANGVGDIPVFTAINNGTIPTIATITVTPNLNGCSGASQIFTITINPSPAVIFTPTNQIVCSGSSSALVHLTSTAGTNFSWTALQPAGITGVSSSGTDKIPVQPLINSTNLPIVITYLAIAESNSGVSCQGIIYPYTITVNPILSAITPQTQTICSNTAFSLTPLDGSGNVVPAGTTYSWGVPTATGGITGGATMADQATISGILINPTDAVQTATYTITPKSGTCVGTSFTVVVTVNPSPKVKFSGDNQTLCSGSASLPITLSSPAIGTVTFSWTANVPTGISGATPTLGTDTIPTQTLVNLTTNPLTVIYTATATFENNGVSCPGQTLDYKIMVNPAIITSSILSNFNGFNVSTVGATDGAINVTVAGGSGSYTYLWSGPSGFPLTTSQDISNVPAGAYTLTIIDGLCNPVTLNFTLTSPLPLIIQEDTSAQINVFCFGYLTGAIKVDIKQQSVGPYDYLLTLQGGGIITNIVDSVATNYTFTGLAAGIYDIKVTDANGSAKTITGMVITQPNGITALISTPTNVSCAGSATGLATVTASGGNGTLTYSWNTNPIQTTATASGLIAGTYIVTIRDANNCSIQKQAVITEPNGITTTITTQTNVLCFGNKTGSASVSATGGTGVLTYSWDTIPMQTTVTATGLVAGTYNVIITDANGCSKAQSVLITQPSARLGAIISNSTNVSCFGGNNGNATVLVTGGTSPYSYSWNTSPIQTSATAIGLTADTYNVTVTDANGCVIASPITITEPAGMSATITAQTDVFCSGNSTGSATVSVTGGTAPFSYSWNTTPVQTSAIAINLAIGTYTATITDSNGCTTTTQASITEPNGIVISITSKTNVNCFGNNTGAVSIIAGGGTGILTYSWDTNPVQTSLNATGLIAGTYHLTVTDANNCSKFQTVNITQPDDINITTDLEKDITCFNDANGEIKITITGGTLNYNYAWTKDGIPYATTEDLTHLSPGIYMVTVSDANNCGPKTATFTITEPPILAVSLINQTNILCYGEATGAIDIAAIGGTPALSGYNFAWTGPNGFTSSNKNLTAIIAGTYNVLVTDNSSCSKALSVTLTQPTAIILSATTTPIICYGSNDASITLAINGGVNPYTITWSNLGGGTFQNNLSAGDYLITVTDSNNCVKTLNVNIPEAPIFTINPVVKNISCFGSHDGSINLNIIGGIAPVKLVWDDSSIAGNVRNNLGPGSYTVTIVDSKPCTIKRTFIILEPQPLILSGNTTNAFDCDNANSGAINLLVAGGTPPFTYAWSNGSTTEDLMNIPAGNYLVTVIDSRGCSKQAQYSINRPPPIVIGVATKTEFDCETKFVKQTFVAQVSGGVPPYQLTWSSGTVSGSNNEMMNTSQNGTAILYVTDALGCKANYSFNVKLQSLGTPSFNATSYSFLTYGTYSIIDPIQFTNTATGDFISMVWDFGDGNFSKELNPVHTFLNPKEYVVTQTVTYPFGCVYVQKITFNVEKGYLFVVPTAFTPNNDTMNDTFRPVTKALKNVRLDIYDTWGSLIYSETGDTLKGWDGKIKGQNAENGNYYCKVSAETFYGTIVNENHPLVLIK